jgi:hypothetical protein
MMGECVHPKHVELFAGYKILYKKCHLVGTFLKIKKKEKIMNITILSHPVIKIDGVTSKHVVAI